jgi:hypothetical protein
MVQAAFCSICRDEPALPIGMRRGFIRNLAHQIDNQQTVLERRPPDFWRPAPLSAAEVELEKRQKVSRDNENFPRVPAPIAVSLIWRKPVRHRSSLRRWRSPGIRARARFAAGSSICRWFATLAGTNGLQIGRPPADRQQHEQSPITLVPGGRTATFSPAHNQAAVMVVHPPFPTPAALDHDYILHGRPNIGGCRSFQGKSVDRHAMRAVG